MLILVDGDHHVYGLGSMPSQHQTARIGLVIRIFLYHLGRLQRTTDDIVADPTLKHALDGMYPEEQVF